jgi:transcriptional regulator with XRE-family HTH domain
MLAITERAVGVLGRIASSSDLVKGSAPGYCPVSAFFPLRAQNKTVREIWHKDNQPFVSLTVLFLRMTMLSHNQLIMVKSKRVGGHVRGYSGQSGSHEDRLERDLKRRRKEFRKRIIEARKAVGISQRELAVMIGCSQSLVSRVERGGEVDFVLFERWAAALTAPSFQTFATLDWRERATYPLATERHYRGHSIEEWKQFRKLRRWAAATRLL